MRTAMLTTTLVGLITVVPCAAQTARRTPEPVAQRPETRKSKAPEIFVAVLSGAYEVPAVETQATGTAEVTLVGSRLHYQIHVDALGDITGAYVHIGRAGEDDPAVADLFEGVKAGRVSGVLASGTLRATDLHGTTMWKLIHALRKDEAYITVHTLTHPGGALRGQLRIQPMVASR